MLRFVFIAIAWLIAGAWGDWRHWRNYHSTILYVVSGNLLYNVFSAEYPLWHLNTEIANHLINHLLLSLLFLPPTILVFLSHFPYSSPYMKRIIAILLGTLYMSVIEYIQLQANNIHYHNGWSFTWSVILNVILFTFSALHHKKPLVTYGLSVVVVSSLLLIFGVPITKMR